MLQLITTLCALMGARPRAAAGGARFGGVSAATAPSSSPKPAPKTKRATRPNSATTTTTNRGENAVLIVESPAKCATISKFLGGGYTLLASNGHVRSLPSRTAAVRPEADFEMDFEVTKGSERVVAALCRAVKAASAVYLATDPDREGEAIAWHIKELLHQRGALVAGVPVSRVAFSEITETAVRGALARARPIDEALVAAQQARQAIDYLFGFTLSPLLWRKLPGCRSAGRVQSVALRLLVEREEERARFVAQEYWSLGLSLAGSSGGSAAEAEAGRPVLAARLTELGGKRLAKFDIGSAASAGEAVASLRAAPGWRVDAIKRSSRVHNPKPPYNTASLQQHASSQLSLSVSEVMYHAQKLYEGLPVDGEPRGLITYMRTDSLEMSDEAIEAARSYATARFGADHVSEEARRYRGRNARSAQEAHEAIRPVDFSLKPEKLESIVPPAELALYTLIWRRALASQMASSEHELLAITLRTEDGTAAARASATRVVFAGFETVARPAREEGEAATSAEEDDEAAKEAAAAAVAGDGADDDLVEDAARSALLETLREGDDFALASVDEAQHFTTPPPRYSEGKLVSRLEELGVGRPSTYGMVLRVLKDREYAAAVSRQLSPKPRGLMVNALLVQQLERYVQYQYTASLEEGLDAVAAGSVERNAFLGSWWSEFEPAVSQVQDADTLALRDGVVDAIAWSLFPSGAAKSPADAQGATADAASADVNATASVDARACPSCQSGRLSVKFSRYGPFLGCDRYPNCSYTRVMDDKGADGGGGPILGHGRVLGTDAESSLEVSERVGPYGLYVQLGGSVDAEQDGTEVPDPSKMKIAQLREELTRRKLPAEGRKAELAERLAGAPDLARLVPRKRQGLLSGMVAGEVTLEQALRLLALPIDLGAHPTRGGRLHLGVGPYGAYVRLDGAEADKGGGEPADKAASEPSTGTTASLPKALNVFNVTAAEAAEVIERKLARGSGGGAKPKPRARRAAAKPKPKKGAKAAVAG